MKPITEDQIHARRDEMAKQMQQALLLASPPPHTPDEIRNVWMELMLVWIAELQLKIERLGIREEDLANPLGKFRCIMCGELMLPIEARATDAMPFGTFAHLRCIEASRSASTGVCDICGAEFKKVSPQEYRCPKCWGYDDEDQNDERCPIPDGIADAGKSLCAHPENNCHPVAGEFPHSPATALRWKRERDELLVALKACPVRMPDGALVYSSDPEAMGGWLEMVNAAIAGIEKT